MDPKRAAIDLANLPPWVVDELMDNLRRAAPESATEAMLVARRGYIPEPDRRPLREQYLNPTPERTPLPHEWDKAEAERFGPGYHWEGYKRPKIQRRVVNEYGDLPEDASGMVRLPPVRQKPIPPRRVPNDPIQPYPFDADQARTERRLANAKAILASGRQNPEVFNQLPAMFRLPLNDDLLARLAAESPQVVLRKAIQDNPKIVGGLMGAGGVLGGGIAYGLMGED